MEDNSTIIHRDGAIAKPIRDAGEATQAFEKRSALSLEQVYSAITYYLAHRAEVVPTSGSIKLRPIIETGAGPCV